MVSSTYVGRRAVKGILVPRQDKVETPVTLRDGRHSPKFPFHVAAAPQQLPVAISQVEPGPIPPTCK